MSSKIWREVLCRFNFAEKYKFNSIVCDHLRARKDSLSSSDADLFTLR
jgi:hypothetical protein